MFDGLKTFLSFAFFANIWVILVRDIEFLQSIALFMLLFHKGSSIKDVSSEGEGGAYKKWHFGKTFKA